MSKRMPSLLALLGLVAVAGYQNREKISEFVKGLSGSDPAGGVGGAIDNVKKAVTGGLGELVDQFKQSGQGDKAQSWVGKGPNAPITDSQMEQALSPDLIETLVKQTGLTKEELLARLSKVLPETVDKLTPEGQVPA